MVKKKAFFEPVDLNINFPDEEKKLLEFWYKKGIVKKYLSRNKSSKKTFSFLDGPITANGPMGVHHAWGRTYKDLWPRFYNMRGYKQRFQNGFDCQGLWVEVEVEKELGFKSKKDIEKFGISKFVRLCRDRVKKFSKIQTEQSKRLGYFADWENSYYTLSDDNNYAIWGFLKVCHENGWLYKGKDSTPWCPRCETAISQHEMLTEDYKEVSHKSIYLSFPIVGTDKEYLLVWTTTPWTIPANIAVAVDNKLIYVQVESNKNKYWVAKESYERVFRDTPSRILKEERGEKLVGLKYAGAFDMLPAVGLVARENESNFHTVVATDDSIMPISVSEGTGLVHTAVSAGSEDFRLGKKYGLPMIAIINDDASYMSGLGFLEGQNAKKHPEIIFDFLGAENKKGNHWYLKTENILHRYPACWRCKSELVWKVSDEWYIAMDKPAKIQNSKFKIQNDNTILNSKSGNTKALRERMIAVAQKINWLPAFGLDRELDWLKNMHDWLISKKNRYWGLALPIWECENCGNFEVIGSKDELKTKAKAGWSNFEGKTPHKPQIDYIKLKCASCGGKMNRIEPVGNPWLDAGIVPFSTISENNKASSFEKSQEKPLYIANREKWLNWYPIDFITESFPGQFKNWFYSLIAMSSVLEDTNPFKTVLGYGTLLGEDGRPMHKSWGNSIEFNEAADKIGVDVMRLMFARSDPTSNVLFGYKAAEEVRRRFHLKLWNVYNFFVTYANLVGYTPNSQRKVKAKDLGVLDKWILVRLNETIQTVTKSLEAFDASGGSLCLEEFLDDLSNWYIRRSRTRVQGAEATAQTPFFDVCYFVLINFSKVLAPFNPFTSDFIYKNLTKEESVHLTDWPSFSSLTKTDQALVEAMSSLREIVERVHAERKSRGIGLRQPLRAASVSYPGPKLRPDIISIGLEELNLKELKIGQADQISVKLDEKITPELEEEAKARELMRRIQEERKRMGISLSAQVNISTPWLPRNKSLLKILSTQVRASKFESGEFKVEEV